MVENGAVNGMGSVLSLCFFRMERLDPLIQMRNGKREGEGFEMKWMEGYDSTSGWISLVLPSDWIALQQRENKEHSAL